VSLARLRGAERQRAHQILAWAQGKDPGFGPDPWGVSPWLAWRVEVGGRHGGNPEDGWQAACELVLVANRLRPAPTPPEGWINPRAPSPLADEPIVKLAHEVLGGRRVW